MKYQDLRRYGVLLSLSLGCGPPEVTLFTPPQYVPAPRGSTEPESALPRSPSAASQGLPSGPASASADPDSGERQGQQVPSSQVLWTTPADGETGVVGNREVVLQFNEPMNIASVAAALTSTLPGEVSLAWEGGATLLRLRPSLPLPYADGPASAALEFSVSISEPARSLSGKPLAPSTLAFRTLRRVQLSLEPSPDPELTGVALGTDPPAPAPQAAARPSDPTEPATPISMPSAAAPPCLAPDSICAGDLSASSGEGVQVKSFLTFELDSLPAGAQLESARLQLFLEHIVGSPFGQRGLGSLHAERSWFSRIDASAFRADPDATLAVLSDAAEQTESQDISWVIQEARERGLTQYRLTFPQTSNRDATSDLAVLLPSRQRLELSYLIP